MDCGATSDCKKIKSNVKGCIGACRQIHPLLNKPDLVKKQTHTSGALPHRARLPLQRVDDGTDLGRSLYEGTCEQSPIPLSHITARPRIGAARGGMLLAAN